MNSLWWLLLFWDLATCLHVLRKDSLYCTTRYTGEVNVPERTSLAPPMSVNFVNNLSHPIFRRNSSRLGIRSFKSNLAFGLFGRCQSILQSLPISTLHPLSTTALKTFMSSSNLWNQLSPLLPLKLQEEDTPVYWRYVPTSKVHLFDFLLIWIIRVLFNSFSSSSILS